jgi:polysaccharide biosynthesis/export protein
MATKIGRGHLQVVTLVLLGSMSAATLLAQAQGGTQQTKPAVPSGATTTAPPSTVVPPPDYLIGAGDVISIFTYREPDYTREVPVRPDGKITMPLVNDIQAVGLTTEALGAALTEAYKKWVQNPIITVSVKQINSRKVCISGNINKTGCFDLSGPMDVLTLVAMSGGLADWSKKKLILFRTAEQRPDGKPWTFEINYNDLMNRRRTEQNMQLKPGDNIIVR